MSETISKASVCEILADIYPTDGEKVVAVKEIDKAYEAIQQLPSSQPEIIRCKDCRFYPNHGYKKDVVFDADACHWNADEMPDPDDYCSAAERREE